jgi:hypothetical protein
MSAMREDVGDEREDRVVKKRTKGPLAGALKTNVSILDSQEKELAQKLVEGGEHEGMFSEWAEAGTDDKGKHDSMKEMCQIDEQCPGGIDAYMANAMNLMALATKKRSSKPSSVTEAQGSPKVEVVLIPESGEAEIALEMPLAGSLLAPPLLGGGQ